ncbi:MAG: sigma-70 family RNA polymerase sigma factor [Phycisphaerales bacterium]|nr:MAG: sigma-70 family RNA polymerase sigma factor [Phycisphaerales bacterium]
MTDGIDGHLDKAKRFEQTALPNLDHVYRAAVALCGRSNEADDLTQTTFMKALERFDTFEPGTNCKAWLFQILRNLWIDQLRRKKVAGSAVPLDEVLVAQEAEVQETVWSDAEDLLENFSDDQVIAALRQLPDDQRLTLFLVDVEQLSQQEVAEITGVAVGTVKSRTSRARREFKNRLTSYAKDMGFKGCQR